MVFIRTKILSLADESRQWDLQDQVRKVPGHLLPVPTFLSRPIQCRSYLKRVADIPNVGFYSLPKIMGRTGRFIYDGLRLISLGCKQKQKNTNIVQKPNTALVAVGHFPLSPYRLPVGSSANKSLHWGYR